MPSDLQYSVYSPPPCLPPTVPTPSSSVMLLCYPPARRSISSYVSSIGLPICENEGHEIRPKPARNSVEIRWIREEDSLMKTRKPTGGEEAQSAYTSTERKKAFCKICLTRSLSLRPPERSLRCCNEAPGTFCRDGRLAHTWRTVALGATADLPSRPNCAGPSLVTRSCSSSAFAQCYSWQAKPKRSRVHRCVQRARPGDSTTLFQPPFSTSPVMARSPSQRLTSE